MYGRNRYGTTRYGATGVRTFVKALSAVVSVTASTVRETGKILSGLAKATGSVIRETAKGLSATALATGTVGRVKIFHKAITGAVAATGTLIRKTGKIVTGLAAATGTINRKTGKIVSGLVSAVGTIPLRRIWKEMSTNVAATGSVIRKAKKNLPTALVSATATLNRKAGKIVTGLVTAVGTIPLRRIWKQISGNVVATGTVGRHTSKALTALVDATGVVIRKTIALYEGGVIATATIGKLVKKTLTATVTATAKVPRVVYDMAYEMNKTIRQILAKVQITYSDPFFSAGIAAEASETGRMTYPEQTTDNVETTEYKWFSLHRNVLDGTFHPMPSNKEYSVGWWSATLSDGATAEFTPNPVLTITHAARTIESLLVVGDDKLNEYPVDFWVRLYSVGDVLEYEWHETGNSDVRWEKAIDEADIVKQVLTIEKWSRVSSVAKISQFFTMLEETYTSEDGDLFSIRVLEEREFQQTTIPQGNISANAITVRLANIDHLFTDGNYHSRLSGLLLNNRAIKAWLGCDLHSGERIWLPLGTFYSRDWKAPEGEAWAEVSGYDMLDRLKQTEFSTSEVYTDVTLHDLAVTVMADAGLTSEDWEIDADLDTAAYEIPYAWFNPMSHREALRIIAAAALGQVYCDRDGKVVIKVYTAPAAQPYDFEFDQANIFTVDHPLEWSKMINSVQARANPREASAEQDICLDTETFTVPGSSSVTKTHFFDLSPCVDVVDPVVFTNPGGHVTLGARTVYAWGMSQTYTNSDPGDETVTDVTIRGKPLEIQGGRVVTAEDATSIASNGRQTLSEPISSEFWQSETQSQAVADSLLASYKDPLRNVIMKARGNIALLLGDRVVAPDFEDEVTSEYGLMRQDIKFDGGMEVAVAAQRIIGGETKYHKSLTADVVAIGDIAFWVHKAAVLATGVVVRKVKKTLTATVTATGAIVRTAGKSLSGSAIATGAAGRMKLFHKTVSGIVSAVGSVGREISKSLTGNVVAVPTIILPRADFLLESGAGDGTLGHAVYNTVWTAAESHLMDNGSSSAIVGQRDSGVEYTIWRLYPIFDTDLIPAGSTILKAELFFALTMNLVEKSTDMVLQNGQPTYPHNPAVVGDWDKSQYSGDGGSIELYGKSLDTYYSFELNATGRGWIQMGVGAITKLCLRTEHDIDGNDPIVSVLERAAPYLAGGSYPMYLKVTWEV